MEWITGYIVMGKEAKWKSLSILCKQNEEVKMYIFVCSFVEKETQERKPDTSYEQGVIGNRDQTMGGVGIG